jgi:hypothetical protein
MVTHPITVGRHYYRGKIAKLQRASADKNRIAADMESKINEMLLKQTEPVKIYDWGMIASATGYSMATIKEYGYSIDGGSNGFTAHRHDLTYDQAMAANREPT